MGEGGFATVWKAEDSSSSQLVAVKILQARFARDPERVTRFFRGARTMAALRHPGIVSVIEKKMEEDGLRFFVMEYLPGGDLRRAVLEKNLPPHKVFPLILKVGEALSFAHEKKCIHRDVKPANILLDGENPKLTDFDLVRVFDSTLTRADLGGMGTLVYTAPEVLDNADHAEALADVYSLARTAIFAWLGRELSSGAPDSHIEELPCSSRAKAVLRWAVEGEPAKRPPSIKKFCDELKYALQEHRPGEKRLNEADGSILVYVPGGEYTLGAEDLGNRAQPVHRVQLSPFWIGKYLVTNEQYDRFLQANPDAVEPRYWRNERLNQPQQPVVGVSWEDAQAYCRWAGLCLPSEAQWEAAARGPDQRTYPWGNQAPTHMYANYDAGKKGSTTPVGAYPQGAGPFGTLDQAGNVWEWCEDVWNADAYKGRDGSVDPVYKKENIAGRSVRGGAWDATAGVLYAAFRNRNGATDRLTTYGFRCLLPVRLK